MPNRVARLLAVLAVQPRYLPSKIPFVRRRDFCATNIRRGEERASAEASALEVSGKGQCDADNMDETDDLTRRQDASQYNHAEDARPDLRYFRFSSGEANVRFGSLADIWTSPRHVRFTPNNGSGAAHPSLHFLRPQSAPRALPVLRLSFFSSPIFFVAQNFFGAV